MARTLAVCVAMSGCHLIAPFGGAEVAGDYYECVITTQDCPPSTLPLTTTEIGVAGPAKATLLRPYAVAPLVGFGRPYHDAKYVVTHLPSELQGSAQLIQTAFADRNVVGATHTFSLSWNVPRRIADVYVAFDSRTRRHKPPKSNVPLVGKRPAWLTTSGLWEPTTLVVEVSAFDWENNATSTTFDLFRLKGDPKAGSPVTVGPNAGPGSEWDQWVEDNGHRGMFFLLVTPETEPDCNRATFATVTYDNSAKQCRTTAEEARAATAAKCKNLHTNDGVKCLDATLSCFAKDPKACLSKKDSGLRVFPSADERFYRIRSSVDFAGSTVNATVAGFNPALAVPVTGTLHFDYDAITRQVIVQGIELDVGDIQLGKAAATQVAVGLAQQVAAMPDHADPACANVPLGWPCPRYTIATDGIQVGVSFRLAGKPTYAVLRNSTPVDLRITGTAGSAQTLSFAGTFATNMKFDDGSTRSVQLDLALDGTFLDFAPNPSSGESTTDVECKAMWRQVSDDRVQTSRFGEYNAEPILLTSGSSVQVNGKAHKAAYIWLEDYGTPAQKVIAKAPDVTLPPGTVPYGTHHYTLLMQNSAGLSATTLHTVQVHDTVPPAIIVADITVFQSRPPFAERIDLSAVATDACSTETLDPTHDQNTPSHFGPGTTTVTWRAEDYRGNLGQATQKVTVIGFDPLQIPKGIYEFASVQSSSIARTRDHLTHCLQAQLCTVDVGPHAWSLNRAVEILTERGGGPVEIEALTGVARLVQESAELLAMADGLDDPGMRVEPRLQAAELLSAAQDQLSRLAETAAESGGR